MLRKYVRLLVPPPVRFALRQLALEVRLARLHRASSRKARRYRVNGDLLKGGILASGLHPKPGWINVDLFESTADFCTSTLPTAALPGRLGALHLRRALFRASRISERAETTGWDLEGVNTPSPALQFLRECRRVLAPGGVLDIVVPDAEGMIAEYVNRHEVPDPVVEWWGPRWCDTWMHRLNYLFRQGREHGYAYDEETLAQMLRSLRFCNVKRRPFDPALDAPNT